MRFNPREKLGAAMPERVSRPAPRASDIHYEVSPPTREERPQRERAFSYVPWPLRLLVKMVVTSAVMAGGLFGPAFLDCRKLREDGGFFHGVTMTACTRQSTYERIATMQQQFETLARVLASH
ncbi:hypothetical protein [Methylobacterium sp. JK268]